MRVQVVSPWYPDRYSPYSGIFVKKQVDALKALGHEVAVEVPVIYPAPQGDVPESVYEAMRDLAAKDPTSVFVRQDGVVRIPAPVPSRSGDMGRAEAYAAATRVKRTFMPVEADVTHAHLGVPTGWALLQLGDHPLVVTEHQSTLDRVFSQPGGIQAYRDVLEGAKVLCVSGHLKEQIVAGTDFAQANSIEVVPNIVDLSDIPFRERTRRTPVHWIYVGTIAVHKGIELLLRAFKVFSRRHGSATLTVVGEGPHRPWVERFGAGAGLSRSISFVGSVSHEEVGAFLDKADVFVHLSKSETFGIASLEAIGAGLPVVSLRNGGAESAWGDFEGVVGRLLPTDVTPIDVADAVATLGRHGHALDHRLGRQMVQERFSPEHIAEDLTAIYQRIR